MADGFWGVDDHGGSGKAGGGIRRGKGGTEIAPAEAKTADGGGVFRSGDLVGLLVDMDARTLAIYRNGAPIPGLAFTGLPAEVYVGATPYNHDVRVRIEQKAPPARAPPTGEPSSTASGMQWSPTAKGSADCCSPP